MKTIHSLLNMWSARHLSLKGKITVLKSLVMPHILHLASVLYISDEITKSLEKMFLNFVWSNRKHGIAKSTLVQPIELGGLKMICISSMVKSAKIMFIKRLLNDSDAKWKRVTWFFMNLSKCELFSRLIYERHIHKCNIPFYDQILRIWFEFIVKRPRNIQEILHENIFRNSFITIDNNPIINDFQILRNVNILKIKDIMSKNGKYFLDRASLNKNYDINFSQLQYNQLISAIPRGWKITLKNGDSCPQSKLHYDLFSISDISKQSNKNIYDIYIKEMYNPPISQNNWIESYPFLEAASWIDIYKLPFAVCRDTYIQSLQYKILHRYFNCNSNLFKWKIREDPYCNECGNIDTIEHFFYYCRVVNIFWNRIENWLKNIMEIYVKFTLLEIILGITFKNSFAHLCNYIILHAKHFIYIKKKI